ncbi:MAG: hypothetical protein WCG00_18960 [Hyphomicrobiales bacterium]
MKQLSVLCAVGPTPHTTPTKPTKPIMPWAPERKSRILKSDLESNLEAALKKIDSRLERIQPHESVSELVMGKGVMRQLHGEFSERSPKSQVEKEMAFLKSLSAKARNIQLGKMRADLADIITWSEAEDNKLREKQEEERTYRKFCMEFGEGYELARAEAAAGGVIKVTVAKEQVAHAVETKQHSKSWADMVDEEEEDA